jgi:hypothetical protein
MEKLIVEIPSESICIKEAFCPNGHSLMEPGHPMGDSPSIKVLAVSDAGVEGEIYLNAWYGNFEVDSSFPMKEGDVLEIYCPTCRADMRRMDERCSFCGARMFQIKLPKGGIVEACSRKGCHNHRLKVVDLSTQLGKLFDFDTRPRY